MKVLVTGGSGFLGTRLKRHRPSWLYPTSRELNLKDSQSVHNYLEEHRPDCVVHLAAKVGGIKDNTNNPSTFFSDNILMNTNLLNASIALRVPRILSCLSTCVFPEEIKQFPFNEEVILQGPPPASNLAYGFAKRGLYIHSNIARQQHGLNYSTFSPSNLYGPNDNFDPDRSHFVAALIKKTHEALLQDKKTIEMWGTGAPKRQQLFVDDLAEIIPILLEKHNSELPLIVAPSENLSILEMCETLKDALGVDLKFIFNQKLDGQFRKDGDNSRFLSPDPQL